MIERTAEDHEQFSRDMRALAQQMVERERERLKPGRCRICGVKKMKGAWCPNWRRHYRFR